eukprot:TRINITY_DN17599_c0_g1_i1.p2 TRINITY_DN17599_c0_g1~~TRINITY_DN17599_c0_g1_i1.p2  ORF type:complete len:143 (-),score=19.73 TRINITY_DN17599_c0_g1_i1:124-552(-)
MALRRVAASLLQSAGRASCLQRCLAGVSAQTANARELLCIPGSKMHAQTLMIPDVLCIPRSHVDFWLTLPVKSKAQMQVGGDSALAPTVLPGSAQPTGLAIIEPGVDAVPMQAVSTRKELRRWKHRRKRDGGKDRNFRLKYG